MADETMNRGLSANLDLLRGSAVLMVLFDHLCRHFYLDHAWGIAVVDIGMFGVLLFFVHTSLVLMNSMQRSGLSGIELLKSFYTRRFFRVYPLSVFAVLAAVALHLHADGRGLAFGLRPRPLEVASNLLLTQNLTYSDSIIGPLWSLPIEVQMYIVLPFLFLWKRRSVLALLVLWLVCGILGHWPQVIPALGWFTLLIFIPNFLPGVIAFSSVERRVIPSYLWPGFIIALCLVYSLHPSRKMGGALCLLLGLTIPLFREISFAPLKLLSKWIATYSYGIYLAHSFCIWFALTMFHSWTLFGIAIIALPVALYYGIERPGIVLGARLSRKLSKPEVPKELAAAA
jgi:peptidoglycan/LPS O-acetylase OafA/YrhL